MLDPVDDQRLTAAQVLEHKWLVFMKVQIKRTVVCKVAILKRFENSTLWTNDCMITRLIQCDTVVKSGHKISQALLRLVNQTKNEHRQETIESMRQFNAKRKMKAAMTAVMATNILRRVSGSSTTSE